MTRSTKLDTLAGILLIASASRWLHFFFVGVDEEMRWALLGRELIIQFPILALGWFTGSAWVLWKARQVGPIKEEVRQPRREGKRIFRQAA